MTFYPTYNGQQLPMNQLVTKVLDFWAWVTELESDWSKRFLARLHEVHRAIAVTPVVHVPVPVPVRVPVRVRVTLALKFSRSPYLDNHSLESIHTWTIDTL